ncbi:DUF2332 domain-containing protein [Mycobacterium colombiense]|uniref:DUF2332 domain-containing protein n=1 Tax=Mycobacterium colombiense TaxID=339268 RepID=A0A329M2Q9_9MYCO|nr:DUF2332 family protein [Mycobacterium colombiense]RAV12913.1 DUF2332 domain-containing protein [Mycobacterium colombiense]
MTAEHLVHTLRSQGKFCASSGSRMYGELFELVAGDVEAGGVFATVLSGREDAPSRDAVPLRLLGGLHRLVLDGRAARLRRFYPSTGGVWDADRAWREILDTAAGHVAALRAALAHPPQTNEVGRSAALIGGLLRINHEFGLPIRLFEIGSSAGLNLRADRYRYLFAGGQWGPAGSPVTIDDAWRGALPPRRDVPIVARHGYDIAPIDVATTDGEMTVLSYVWPDQDARLARLRGAIDIARRVPAALERKTASAAEERGAVRAHVHALAARADARAPFAHLTMEPTRAGPGAPIKFVVRARVWPDGDPQLLGQCHPHGPPVDWLRSP